MAGAAAAEMAAEQQRLAAEVARNRIEEERHGLVVAELKRRDELVEIVETGKDDAGRREAQRELAMIQLRAQRREEALKASGVNIKVVENLVIENGKVVGTTKNIVRERTALTDADAGRLMGDVAGDLSHANAPVAVTGASTNNRVQDVEGGML
ncbi:hypothetical protein BC830DRAFT_1159450 [Chytriomyces sp. MP71]|nr:hypothetical protein BC830DRAFT_1159450 [Chytriomyces sp. MP71]